MQPVAVAWCPFVSLAAEHKKETIVVATVIINELNGADASKTNKTSGTIRFKNADNSTVDLNDPMVVPGSGQDYSIEKWLRMEITGGTFTQISNLRAYSDGSNNFGTGVKLWYAVDGVFSTPVQPSEAQDPPQHDAVAMTDLFSATQGAPIDLDGINAGPFTGPGDIGDFLVMVLEVEPTASQGVLPTETLTLAYDEI
jgi:hypothetical protein